MKYTSRAMAVALLTAGTASGAAWAQAAPTKVAFVDSRLLMTNAPGRAEAEGALQREVNAMQAEIKRMTDSLDAIVAAYRKDEATLSPPMRETRQKAIEDLQRKFSVRNDSLQQRAERRQDELTQPLFDLVSKVLQDVRSEDGYTMIIDIGQNPNPIVAYDKNLDITTRVLARVKAQPVPKLPIEPTSGAAGVKKPGGR
jgi:Skp family chaperone for outer membrane proteins